MDIAGGIVQQPLQKLTGWRGRLLYGDMSRDPVLAGLLLGIRHTAAEVEWSWEPDDNATGDGHVAFVTENWQMLDPGWPDILNALLKVMLPYGFDLYEPVFEVRDNRVWWSEWSPRHPASIIEWERDDRTNKVTAAVQQTSTIPRQAIPMAALMHFRTDLADASPEGMSVLLPAVEPWYFKHQIQEIEATGIERDNVGTPTVGVPPSMMSPNASAHEKAALEEYKELARNMRVSDASCLVFPRKLNPQSGEPEIIFELMASPGAKMFDTGPVITRYNVEMAMSLMGDWLYLGHDKSGSWSLATVKVEQWNRNINSWLDRIATVVSKQGAKMLLALNGLDGPPPKLVHTPVRSVDLEALAKYVVALSNSGNLTTPDVDLENHLRAAGQLPEVSEEALQAAEETRRRMEELTMAGFDDETSDSDDSDDSDDDA